MRIPRLRSARTLAVAAGAALLGVTALSACDPAPNNQVDQITIVGSDTTQDIAGVFSFLGTFDSGWNPDGDKLSNVRAIQDTALTVPGDSACGSITWHTPAGAGERVAPNGSTDGKNALAASVAANDGCVDVARSSSAPKSTDPAQFEYYAFGLDAVGWASPSTKAPSNLTLAQVRGIYNCTFTNWSQVNGDPGPIQRYIPQDGSGTRSFFISDVLGFDPTTISNSSCPAVNQSLQEHVGPTTGKEAAILGYSAGRWAAQANGTSSDTRNGTTVRSLNGQSPLVYNSSTSKWVLGGPVTESNVKLVNSSPAYPGVRYVFNVLHSGSKQYGQAIRYFGFTNTANGWKSKLCTGAFSSYISNYGFAPLDTSNPNGSNAAGSNCRYY